MTVPDNLRSRIAAHGPVYFDEFMEYALYGAGGFFARGPLRSAATGDFLTSPEVSPWFGKTLGRFLASQLDLETIPPLRGDQPGAADVEPGAIPPLRGDRLGAARTRGGNRPIQIVEVGAGSGSLLESLLPELTGEVEAWAVEVSPIARDSLGDVVHTSRVVGSLGELPAPLSGAIVANELIDNLPVALAVRRGSGWVEHAVAVAAGAFEFVEVPSRPEVVDWAGRFGGEVPEGGIVEVQLAAAAWVTEAIGLFAGGLMVLVDYGGTVEELEPRRQQGTLRTYRGHHLGPDPLLEPGETDITVDVNFTALAAVAEDIGAQVSLHRQDDFLSAWGLRDAVRDMKHRELEAARSGDTMLQLEIRTERIAAETLLHPRGLGDFRVLVVEV